VKGNLCFGREKEIGGRGTPYGLFVRCAVRSYRILRHNSVPFPFRFSVSSSALHTYTTPFFSPLPLSQKTLETWISPFCSFPFSIPFFLFIFPQGCNTVSFRKERSKGKKTQFREIRLPAPPPLPSRCETLYINLRFTPLFTSLPSSSSSVRHRS
jgi:hypothetical protein